MKRYYKGLFLLVVSSFILSGCAIAKLQMMNLKNQFGQIEETEDYNAWMYESDYEDLFETNETESYLYESEWDEIKDDYLSTSTSSDISSASEIDETTEETTTLNYNEIVARILGIDEKELEDMADSGITSSEESDEVYKYLRNYADKNGALLMEPTALFMTYQELCDEWDSIVNLNPKYILDTDTFNLWADFENAVTKLGYDTKNLKYRLEEVNRELKVYCTTASYMSSKIVRYLIGDKILDYSKLNDYWHYFYQLNKVYKIGKDFIATWEEVTSKLPNYSNLHYNIYAFTEDDETGTIIINIAEVSDPPIKFEEETYSTAETVVEETKETTIVESETAPIKESSTTNTGEDNNPDAIVLREFTSYGNLVQKIKGRESDIVAVVDKNYSEITESFDEFKETYSEYNSYKYRVQMAGGPKFYIVVDISVLDDTKPDSEVSAKKVERDSWVLKENDYNGKYEEMNKELYTLEFDYILPPTEESTTQESTSESPTGQRTDNAGSKPVSAADEKTLSVNFDGRTYFLPAVSGYHQVSQASNQIRYKSTTGDDYFDVFFTSTNAAPSYRLVARDSLKLKYGAGETAKPTHSVTNKYVEKVTFYSYELINDQTKSYPLGYDLQTSDKRTICILDSKGLGTLGTQLQAVAKGITSRLN